MRFVTEEQPWLERLHENSDQARLETYLRESDAWTLPSLSQRVNLPEFAEKILRHGVALVATTPQGKDIGVAAFYCNDQVSHQAYLTHLAVNPECRGRGVASALLECAKGESRQAGMQSMRLEVYASNVEAKKFYELSGFVETGSCESSSPDRQSLYMDCRL